MGRELVCLLLVWLGRLGFLIGFPEPKPSAGWVLEAACCFSRTKQWKKSYHLFSSYHMTSLRKDVLSKETVETLFPWSAYIWPLLDRAC